MSLPHFTKEAESMNKHVRYIITRAVYLPFFPKNKGQN
jgi:hypothetical protein